jgi:purine-cytosine permease-like protein
VTAPSDDPAVEPTVEPLQPPGVELHSIDYVPASERHGSPHRLGALWFVSGVNLTGLATGVSTAAVGAGLVWTLAATVLGALFGTFFMAFHSAQGPQLGLPQLVQSRAQFGYLGAAATVWIFAFVNYVAYNTSDALLAGDALQALAGLEPNVGYLLSATVAAVVAFYGYHGIHRINGWLSWPLLAVMTGLTVAALRAPSLPADVWTPGPLRPAAFMTVFAIVAGFQLGWAPYVSDYSRYLPADVGVRATFWWTYLPSAASAIWVFSLGAVLREAAGPGRSPVETFRAAGDVLWPGFGSLAVAALFVGLLSIMAINQYGGMMSLISIADSLRPVRPSRRMRALGILAMFLLVWLIARLVGGERFTTFYGNVLIFLGYLFTPWTAINLVDYFLVRKGVYSIGQLFQPDGMYGRWGWRGQTAYVLAIGAMAPFMVTAPYTGFAARALGGVDGTIFVGLLVAGLVYLALCRNLDLAAERRAIAAEGLIAGHAPRAAAPRG